MTMSRSDYSHATNLQVDHSIQDETLISVLQPARPQNIPYGYFLAAYAIATAHMKLAACDRASAHMRINTWAVAYRSVHFEKESPQICLRLNSSSRSCFYSLMPSAATMA